MKPSHSQKKEFSKNLSIVLITILVTVTTYVAFTSNQVKPRRMTEQGSIDDPTNNRPLNLEDSIETINGFIPRSTFEYENDARRWFSDFKSNRVRFDKNYQDSAIDLIGKVSEIKSSWGCAIVEVEAGESAFDKIELSNCPEGKDMWAHEISNISVGQTLHFRGKFNPSSSDDQMRLYECQIIDP